MKKRLSTCASITVLTACTSVFAGGLDEFAVPTPPPPAAPAVEYFNGLNIGIFGGLVFANFDTDTTFKEGDYLYNGNGNDQAGYGGVQATFGKVFYDVYYIGLEGYGNFGEATEKYGTHTFGDFTVINPEINTQAGINLKPGFIIGQDMK